MQIIPIAGKGNRFKENGYLISKYLLLIKNKPIIEHILSFFNPSKETLIILNKAAGHKSQMLNILNNLKFKNYDVVEVGDTDGQLSTVMQGFLISKFASYNGCVWIFNGDTIRTKHMPYELFNNKNNDAFIEVFKENGEHWSFVDKLGDVSMVVEKERISDLCSTGLYGFRDISDLKYYYKNGLVMKSKGELYVSSLYNNFLDDKKSVWSFLTSRKAFHLCGTPVEYENSKYILEAITT